ncbi:hypothetical protein Afe04nite_44500 [Asanoa ferruginea]|nr:hypothetical protein Afe04nite_44500 [Asanoa ferruginea]
MLEPALSEMKAEPAILDGDRGFYERLGARNETESEAWTDYFAGRGLRPG